ncbi:TPA: site-specific integrase [Enterococcus faecalis]|nr:site-specific integrase [Enterococcus faecalis]
MSKRGENIYKRKDGRWEGRFPRGRKIDGKLKYGYIYGSTYQEVRQKLYVAKANQQTIYQSRGQGAFTLNEWIEQWLVIVKKEVKLSTFASYSYKLSNYVLKTMGDSALNEIDDLRLNKLVEDLIAQGLSKSTICVIFGILSRALNHAVKAKHLKSNPCSTISLPKPKRRHIRGLDIEEQKKLENVAYKNPQQQGLSVIVALHTGLRIGELAALRWEDINFKKDTIHVKHTFQRVSVSSFGESTQLYYDCTKTINSERIIPMSNTVKNALKCQKEHSQGKFVFSRNNKPCEPRLLTYYFHKLRDKVQLDKVHFHQLRHTFATRCLESTSDIVSVSALLGHSSTQMTLDIYADSLLEQRIKAIKRMERTIA